ncbi:unnamed protein product [Calicophoron daubneyi]|uniref:Saposin B-type domain-containing protein n=1 Tax=Calicophoron daubneyi TaxID=300641 RepID=A0AAV2T2W7_CALDB
MRLLVLFALIGLSVAVPVYEYPDNFGLCDICTDALGGLISLVKGHAAQEIIDKYIVEVCNPVPIVGGLCKEALNHAVSYLMKHLDESDSVKVCKAIHIC